MSAIEEYGKRKEQKGYEKGFEIGFKEGFEIGKKKARKEMGKKLARKEIFKNFFDSGMSIEEIARRTGIDIKEVEELLD